MFTNEITGGGVYVEPTTTQKQQDEVKASNNKNDECARKIETERAKQKADREEAAAKANTRESRFPALLLGVTRLAAKAKRSGDITKAGKLQVVADEMAAALEVFRTAQKAEAKPVLTPLADAINAAAAELRKVLPKSFQTLADAEDYAGRFLPLSAARIAQVHENDRRVNAGKFTAKAATAFWTLAGKAARIASGSVNDTAIAELENAGSL